MLGIEVPEQDLVRLENLRPFLGRILTDLHAYAASFVAVSTFWVEHTVVSHYTVRSNRTYQWLNLLFLLPLSLLPFFTKVRALCPSEPVAELLFGGALVLSFLLFSGFWRYAISRELVPAGSDPAALQAITRSLLLASLLAAVATAVSVFDSRLGTLVFIAIPLIFLSQRYVDEHWELPPTGA